MLDFLYKHVVLFDPVMQQVPQAFLFHVYTHLFFFSYFSTNVVIQFPLLHRMPSHNSSDNHLFSLVFPNFPAGLSCFHLHASLSPSTLPLILTSLICLFSLVCSTSFPLSTPCRPGFHSSVSRGREENNNILTGLHTVMPTVQRSE